MSTPRANSEELLIEELLCLPLLSSSAKRFLMSLRSWCKSGRNLTIKQKNAIERIKVGYHARPILSDEWLQSWNDSMKERAIICANYYIENPPYFEDLSRRIAHDPNFVPTKNEFDKLTRNRYAIKVLDSHYSTAKYCVGDLVVPRKTVTVEISEKFNFKPASVLKIDAAPVVSAANGSKRYLVLALGATDPFLIEERHIKKYK